jgi:hypothetical protein
MKRGSAVRLISLCLCLGVLLWQGMRMVRDALNPFDDALFTSRGWKAAGHDQRTRMTQDLIDTYLKPGIPRGAVVALLGKPDRIEDKTELEYEDMKSVQVGRTYLYALGASGDVPFHMDGMYLLIVFDSEDRLKETHILQS